MLKCNLNGWTDFKETPPKISDDRILIVCDHEYYTSIRFGKILENGDVITVGEEVVNIANDIVTHWMKPIDLPLPEYYHE